MTTLIIPSAYDGSIEVRTRGSPAWCPDGTEIKIIKFDEFRLLFVTSSTPCVEFT